MVVYINPKLNEIPVLFVEAGNLTIKRRHRKLERQIKAELPAILNLDGKRRRILDSYDRLHARFSNQSFLSAPQYLFKFLASHQRLMQINALVDLYNFISLKYSLALGAHDLAKVDGFFSFNLTAGSEIFYPLGSADPLSVSPGEYAYMDEREILCRLDVKQCEKTKVTTETDSCIFIIQGNAAAPIEHLHAAANELIDLIGVYCRGEARLATVRFADPRAAQQPSAAERVIPAAERR
jgi:DNA/RNA-binding domain of Phe-tRNA-synthetase-like protein